MLDFEFDTKSTSEELRLTSPRSDHFEWLVGAAYFDEDRPLWVDWLAPGFNEAIGFEAIPGGPLVYGSVQDHANKNYSAFADITLKLFDTRLQLTVGGRQFKQDFHEVSRNTGALVGQVGTEPPPDIDSGSETGFVPRFAAKYSFAPTTMLYANVARGFRAGGPSALQIADAACRHALEVAGIAQKTTFDSDRLTNYELGMKTAFADGRAQVDFAAFYVDWQDLQVNLNLNVYDPGCASAVTTNAGSATSKGGEFQFTTRPTDWFLFTAAATYTKARLGGARSFLLRTGARAAQHAADRESQELELVGRTVREQCPQSDGLLRSTGVLRRARNEPGAGRTPTPVRDHVPEELGVANCCELDRPLTTEHASRITEAIDAVLCGRHGKRQSTPRFTLES